MNNSIQIGSVHNNISGFYKAMVVNPTTNEVVKDYGWHKNIILNGGMDLVPFYAYAELGAFGIAGSGSRPNKITSSTSTITQSGAEITLWPGDGLQDFSSSVTSSTETYYTHSLEVGDVIVYNNASQSNVLAVDLVSGLSASVNTSYTIESGSNQTFTIWKTSQPRLHKEVKRTNVYLTGTGNCGSTDSTGSTGVPNVRTYRRTYDFSTETTNKLYTEVGVSPIVTANSQVFSRVVLPVPIAVSSSFQLRLIYDLAITVTPHTVRMITASISGWPVDPTSNTHASESLQSFLLSRITTTGGATKLYEALLEPGPDSSESFSRRSPGDDLSAAVHRGIFVSSNSSSLASFGSGSSRAVNAGVQSVPGDSFVYGTSSGRHSSPPYVVGSYQYYKENSFGLTIGNTTASIGIWSLGYGMQGVDHGIGAGGAGGNQAVCLLFHASQSKFNTQVLSMSFAYAWNRTIDGN
jgi:hypothetical protein